MTLINRQDTAPIQQGEPMDAAEVNAEITTIFTAINGNLSNPNFKAAANIVGSKLANATFTGAKLEASTLTTAKMAASAVPKASVETVTSTGGNVAFTTSATYVDADGFSGVSVTPGSTNDMIVADFTCTVTHTGSGTGVYMFGIQIDAADTDLQEVTLNSTNAPQVIHIAHMVAAGGVSAVTITPRYKKLSGSDVGEFVDDSLRIWRVLVIPIK